MIIERLRGFLGTEPEFKKKFSEQIKDTDSLVDQGVLDSFGMILLIAFIEQTFEINMDTEELLNNDFTTLENIEKFVQKKLS